MNPRRGFTMIEMLVTVSIFAVMTGFLMANFRSGRTADELRQGAQNAASVLREAQSMAMTGKLARVCHGGSADLHLCASGAANPCPGGTCTDEVPRGYGVRFTTLDTGNALAVVFADTDGSHAPSSGEVIYERPLSTSSRVTVSALTPSVAGNLDVSFDPPKPTAYVNGAIAATVASVTVRHATSGATRTVTVNRISGQVSMD